MKLFNEFKKDLPSVKGKVFAITGTTSGTGFIVAKTVAELGGEVLLLNRPSPRVDAAMEKLRTEVPNGKFINIACDLQDFGSVRSAAADIASRYDVLDCLANNAGIMMWPDTATKGGYDVQMQTNHLSHFLLTALLFPLLRAAPEARIVQHSSVARNWTANQGLERKYFEQCGGNLGGDEPAGMQGPSMHRYAQTKLANAVFGYALHDKCQAAGLTHIRSVIAHPGVSKTNLFDHMDVGGVFTFQSPEDGTMGLLTCMVGQKAESGTLYGPNSPESSWAGPAVENPPKPYEIDLKAKEMLWTLSEAATGETLKV